LPLDAGEGGQTQPHTEGYAVIMQQKYDAGVTAWCPAGPATGPRRCGIIGPHPAETVRDSAQARV